MDQMKKINLDLYQLRVETSGIQTSLFITNYMDGCEFSRNIM